MKVKVEVEKVPFEISVGQGLNDFVWLALAAAKLYGKTQYPAGNYLPTNLLANLISVHPRERIYQYVDRLKTSPQYGNSEENVLKTVVFTVELYQPNMVLDEEQKLWFERAFGSKRNIMTVNFVYLQQDQGKSGKNQQLQPQFAYAVKVTFTLQKDLMSEYKASEYNKVHWVRLHLAPKEDSDLQLNEYTASWDIPYGKVEPQLCRVPIMRNANGEEEFEITQAQAFTLPQGESFDNPPQIIPMPEDLASIQNKIKQSMKISEQLSQQLQQQEAENKREAGSNTFCPFEFDNLWQKIENNPEMRSVLDQLEPKIKSKIRTVLTENLNKLYEIFFQYSVLHPQKAERREEISIPFQDIMHFIKFYFILEDSTALFEFCEVYDRTERRCKSSNPKLTLDLSVGVQFPEFIEILIQATNFHMTNRTGMREKESVDTHLEKFVNLIVQIDSSDSDLNEFHKHMKYNITLMHFLRDNSEKFKEIFIEKLMESGLEGNKKFHLLNDQIKAIITEGGFRGENLDEIVNTCLHQLDIGEVKYQGFEGIFYYDFLQVMQWLALVLITDAEEEEEKPQDQQDPEEGVETLIEKLRFFLGQYK